MFAGLCHYAVKCAAICLISAACITTSTAQIEQCCYQTSTTGYCSIGFSGIGAEQCSTTIHCAGPVCSLDIATASVAVWNSCPWFSAYIYSGHYQTNVWAYGQIRDWNGSIVISYDQSRGCFKGALFENGDV